MKVIDISDAQLERVRRQSAERDRLRPRAVRAHYDAGAKRLVVELKNGVTLLIPPRLVQGLSGASDESLASVQMTASGNALHWEALDVQMSVEGLAAGIFGTQKWMEQVGAASLGRKGGRARGGVKAAAVRENGKKGGRPAKSAGTSKLVA